MHRSLVLLQIAETLALVQPAHVRDIANKLGKVAGNGEDVLAANARLRPPQIRQVVNEAARIRVRCLDCEHNGPANDGKRGNEYYCARCGSGALCVSGAAPLPASVVGRTSGRTPAAVVDAMASGDEQQSRVVAVPADALWQTVPFRQAGPFRLQHVLGAYDLMHARAVSALAITSDGRTVFSGGFDRTVKIWDAESGRELKNLTGHTQRVSALVATHDGRSLVSADVDGSAIFWHVKSGKELTRTVHSAPVTSLAISADGTVLAVGLESGGVRLLDGRSARLRRAIPSSGSAQVAVSPDGRRLAVADGDGVRLLPTGGEAGATHGCRIEVSDTIRTLAFAGDKRLVTLSASGAALVATDAPDADPVWAKVAAGCRAQALGVSPDGQTLAIGGADGSVHVFETRTGNALRSIAPAHRDRINATAICGDTLVTGSADHTLRIWSARGGREAVSPHGHRGQVVAVSLSVPDLLGAGARVISASEDGTARVTDLGTGEELRVYKAHAAAPDGSKARRQPPVVRGAAISPDGELALTAADTGEAHIWRVDKSAGETRVVKHPSGRAFTACAWLAPLAATMPTHVRRSPGSLEQGLPPAIAVLGDEAGMVFAIRTQTGEILDQVHAHRRGVLRLATRRDGRRLLSIGGDGSARVFDLGSDRQPLLQVVETAHKAGLRSAALSADGLRMALGSRDVTELVELEPLRPCATLRGDDGWVTAVAFTPDARWVLTASEHGRLSVWGIEPRLKRWEALGKLSLDAATDHISAMALSADGRRLVAGTARGVLLVFDVTANFGVDDRPQRR